MAWKEVAGVGNLRVCQETTVQKNTVLNSVACACPEIAVCAAKSLPGQPNGQGLLRVVNSTPCDLSSEGMDLERKPR